MISVGRGERGVICQVVRGFGWVCASIWRRGVGLL